MPGYEVGDRVVSNGHHAEIVRVPGNLCAKIPDNVDYESPSFTVLGSIALQINIDHISCCSLRTGFNWSAAVQILSKWVWSFRNRF